MGAIEVSVQSVLPLALIAVGVGLIVGSRTGPHGGLVTLGILLTAILAVTSTLDIRIEGGVGVRTVRPSGLEDLEASYRLAAGRLVLDLDEVAPSGATRIEAGVGVGQLVVRVPRGVPVRVHAVTGAGRMVVLERGATGVSLETTVRRGRFEEASDRLHLELSVGMGTLEVSP